MKKYSLPELDIEIGRSVGGWAGTFPQTLLDVSSLGCVAHPSVTLLASCILSGIRPVPCDLNQRGVNYCISHLCSASAAKDWFKEKFHFSLLQM